MSHSCKLNSIRSVIYFSVLPSLIVVCVRTLFCVGRYSEMKGFVVEQKHWWVGALGVNDKKYLKVSRKVITRTGMRRESVTVQQHNIATDQRLGNATKKEDTDTLRRAATTTMRQGKDRTGRPGSQATRHLGDWFLSGERNRMTALHFNCATAQKHTMQGCKNARTQKRDEVMLKQGNYTALQRDKASNGGMIAWLCDAAIACCRYFMPGRLCHYARA